MSQKELDGHIINIIQNHNISEQSELQTILKKQGYHLPQATLSRRLKKLDIAKISGIYKIIHFDQPPLAFILNIKISETGLIVLHTHPGQANSLAYFLDKKHVHYAAQDNKSSGILGTIAGDDTVLLIINSHNDLDNVLNALYEDFPYLKSNCSPPLSLNIF